ncbi:MAG: cytochrome c3 family protein, partial [Pseudomonadota bacterium]
MHSRNIPWLVWAAVTLALAAWLAANLLGDDKSLYLPGATSHGHYQIELACNACHSEAFGGGAVLQDACVACHGDELEVADDSHPKSKFTDPRNAQRVAKLDARECITCHVEHRPEITADMGVTVAADVCFHCHADIADDRSSHAGMAFDTCASAGC